MEYVRTYMYVHVEKNSYAEKHEQRTSIIQNV